MEHSNNTLGLFLLATVSRWVLRATQLPIQWIPAVVSSGVKQSGHEADHSSPSNAEIKNVCSYTSAPPVRLHGVVFN
jgi:hypothetical protein